MSRTPSNSDRRRAPRAELKIPIDYSSVDAFFTEFSANINEGGVFIEIEELPDIDTHVQLQFRVPGASEPVQVDGRVAWTSDGKADTPKGVGIEFHNLTPDSRAIINRIVRELKS